MDEKVEKNPLAQARKEVSEVKIMEIRKQLAEWLNKDGRWGFFLIGGLLLWVLAVMAAPEERMWNFGLLAGILWFGLMELIFWISTCDGIGTKPTDSLTERIGLTLVVKAVCGIAAVFAMSFVMLPAYAILNESLRNKILIYLQSSLPTIGYAVLFLAGIGIWIWWNMYVSEHGIEVKKEKKKKKKR